MALEGNIRDFSLADIFQLIGIQRKTGILTMISGEEEVKVSFLNGMVVHADSMGGRLEDRLGSVLVKTGKLTQKKLEEALKRQKATLAKLGHVLLETELVRPEDLREALGIQITQIIYRLFRWKDGRYQFEQDVNVDYEKENFTPMSAESILMEGMRMIDEWPVIERKISSFDMIFEKVSLEEGQAPVVSPEGDEAPETGEGGDDFDAIFGGDGGEAASGAGHDPKPDAPSEVIKLTREEDLVYQQIDGEVAVQEIIDRTMLSEFEICRALYDLANRNLITQLVRETKKAISPEPKAKRRADGTLLATALQVILAAWLVVGAVVTARSAGERLVPFISVAAAPQQQALKRQLAISRVERVAAAVDLFYLLNRRPPQGWQELVASGILGDGDLHDPWGSRIEVDADEPGTVVISGRVDSEPGGERHRAERTFSP